MSKRGTVCLWLTLTLRAKPCRVPTWSEVESVCLFRLPTFGQGTGGGRGSHSSPRHCYFWTSRCLQSKGAVEYFPLRALPSS